MYSRARKQKRDLHPVQKQQQEQQQNEKIVDVVDDVLELSRDTHTHKE
jgi:hypothetical protein